MCNKETKKIYYQKNKEKILENNKQKLTCECGVVVCKYVLPRHQKTWTHHYFLGNLNK
jgi:hypothetical protein